MSSNRTPPGPPLTVASLKAMGVTGVVITCTKCHSCKTLCWEDVRAHDEGLFPDLAAGAFRCLSCGARDSSMMPDWIGYQPSDKDDEMEHEYVFREFQAETEAGKTVGVTEFHVFDPAVTYARGERRFRLANGAEVKHIGGEHYRVTKTGQILREKA